MQAVADALDDSAFVATDVGQHQMWVAQTHRARPRQWLTSGGLGTMGFGLPTAIGAALANPERTVVCFSGDGSILMNIQEFATLAEAGLNVKVVLMNNASLGLVHQQQELFYGERILLRALSPSRTSCKSPVVFALPSWTWTPPPTRAPRLKQALNAPGPVPDSRQHRREGKSPTRWCRRAPPTKK